MDNAAIGFRSRTGRAIAVVLTGPPSAPAFVWRGEVSLVDAAFPATGEPYHEVMELPWSEATIAVQSLVAAIEARAVLAVRGLIDEMRSRDATVRAVGVVGSPPRNLERLGNFHIRAHAAEGVLFRRVLELAAAGNHLRCCAFSEKELASSTTLGDAAQVKSAMTRLGRAAGVPWRADERMAATAAWIALASSR